MARRPRDRLRSLQDLEDFIAQFGEAGFVLVALGTIVDVAGSRQALEQMHRAFAQLPQGVIWKCSPSLWPEDIPLAANVKLMDWLPQSDLLGKGPLCGQLPGLPFSLGSLILRGSWQPSLQPGHSPIT